MVDPRPTEESVIRPVLDALGEDCACLGSEHIYYYCMCDYDFSLVFERYMCRHTGLVPADEMVTPEEVAKSLQEAHARERVRRAQQL